jgi:hypothetical protein
VIEDILEKLRAGKTIKSYPARLKARDGGIRHVEISSNGHFESGECLSQPVTKSVLGAHPAYRTDVKSSPTGNMEVKHP